MPAVIRYRSGSSDVMKSARQRAAGFHNGRYGETFVDKMGHVAAEFNVMACAMGSVGVT